jgi:hypothetical protein
LAWWLGFHCSLSDGDAGNPERKLRLLPSAVDALRAPTHQRQDFGHPAAGAESARLGRIFPTSDGENLASSMMVPRGKWPQKFALSLAWRDSNRHIGYVFTKRALNPELDIGQHAHTACKVRGGFAMGTIRAIAQPPDMCSRK